MNFFGCLSVCLQRERSLSWLKIEKWLSYASLCRGHNFPVWDVASSPHAYYFASASADKTARVWCTERVTPLRILTGQPWHSTPSLVVVWLTLLTHQCCSCSKLPAVIQQQLTSCVITCMSSNEQNQLFLALTSKFASWCISFSSHTWHMYSLPHKILLYPVRV